MTIAEQMPITKLPQVVELAGYQDVKHNFEDFSRDPAYIEVNRELIEATFAKLPDNFVWVDLAAGTGLIAHELIRLCNLYQKIGRVIAVDLSEFAVESAQKRIAALPDNQFCTVDYLVGSATDASEVIKIFESQLVDGQVDVVSIHDAIHEIPGDENKKIVFEEAYRLLKPGGRLSVNSAFTTTAMEGVRVGWGKWIAHARRDLGLGKSLVEGQVDYLSPEQYETMVREAGFDIMELGSTDQKLTRIIKVELKKSALVAIANYPRFAEGAIADGLSSGKTLDEIISTLQSKAPESLTRYWFNMVGIKPHKGGELEHRRV